MSCPNLITNKYEEDQLQKTFTTRAGTRRGEEGWEFFNICTLYCTPYCTLLCSQLYRWASEILKILHGCTETSQIQHGGTICRMERIDKVYLLFAYLERRVYMCKGCTVYSECTGRRSDEMFSVALSTLLRGAPPSQSTFCLWLIR